MRLILETWRYMRHPVPAGYSLIYKTPIICTTGPLVGGNPPCLDSGLIWCNHTQDEKETFSALLSPYGGFHRSPVDSLQQGSINAELYNGLFIVILKWRANSRVAGNLRYAMPL